MVCPDFSRDLEEVMAGNEERMHSIFGWRRFPCDFHYWGYTVDTLSELARKVGFTVVGDPPSLGSLAHSVPYIRVEATK